ncbi:MAG: adenylate/guanylate cyclase domain-containing protein [Pseudomonadota bacterium]
MTAETGQFDTQIRATFRRAEEQGLKIALRGKIVAVALLVSYLAVTRGPASAPVFLMAGALFIVFGMLHYWIIGTSRDRPWVKYVFITIDIALLSVFVALGPADLNHELPKAMTFRFGGFHYYYVIVAIAGFSFSPGLMLWAGVAGSIGWVGAFYYVLGNADRALQWSDVPAGATPEQFLAVVLDPHFLPFGTRLQESMLLIIIAALLTLVMSRARRTVYAHLEAEAERRNVSDLFGRHVPRSVAELMIEARGELAPTERQATVLFADVAGFTNLTERLGPTGITNVLNAYFDDAANIIGAEGGIITQFQGDAILAVFNLPASDPDHAGAALRAGTRMLEKVASSRYDGETIGIRVGINTGNVVAGNVGGGGRENYTVHGDAVNAAARLEAMNKDLGTTLLVSKSTADLVPHAGLERVGSVDVRGQSDQTVVFTRPVVSETSDD